MKTFLYDETTIDLLGYLKDYAPEHIFSDEFYSVVFDYGDFHINVVPEDFVAISQNKSDEAITAKFEKINGTYQKYQTEKLLFQGKKISRIWILRTLLYFTNYIHYNSEEEALGSFEINTETDKALANVLRKTTGGYSEVVCHPKSEEATAVNQEFANLVDAGVMLEIEGDLLMCFAWDNVFQVVGRVMSLSEVEEKIASSYEFIEI